MPVARTKGRVAKRVKRIICWNNYTRIERRRVNALVRTVGTRFLGTRDQEAIVQLQPRGYIIVQFNRTAEAIFARINLQAVNAKPVKTSAIDRYFSRVSGRTLLGLKERPRFVIHKLTGQTWENRSPWIPETKLGEVEIRIDAVHGI